MRVLVCVCEEEVEGASTCLCSATEQQEQSGSLKAVDRVSDGKGQRSHSSLSSTEVGEERRGRCTEAR